MYTDTRPGRPNACLNNLLILEDLLHSGTRFQSGERVLEAGCGVGAQTRILARRNPEAAFECVDISPEFNRTGPGSSQAGEFKKCII